MHSEELLDLFKQLLVPVEATVFETRMGEIIQSLKSGIAI